MKMIKRQIDAPECIDTYRTVSLKSMGNIKELSISDRINSGATIQPISKEEYVILSTGEVKQVVHHALDRTENYRNLEKTMRGLSDLINANVTQENVECCRFITFTYRENMTDAERLYSDFKNFNKRFKRHMEKQGDQYEYIITVEAQERGAFHLHGIYIFQEKAPFIENTLLADMWRNGFVSIKAMNKNIDNIGKYLTAYLSDLPVKGGTDISVDVLGGMVKDVEADGQSKRIIKGARLKLLPAGIRIYRYSRGVKKPIKEQMTYGKALNILAETGFSKVHEYAIEISDVDRDFKSKFIKQTYKKHINTSWQTIKGGDNNEKF